MFTVRVLQQWRIQASFSHFTSSISRCDVPADPCPDIPHHWRNSWLLHGFGPNTRTCCSGVHCSRILTLLQADTGFCLVGWFVLFSPTHHKYSFLFLADWTTGHATLLVFGIPVVPLWIQEWLGNLPAGGGHEGSWDSLCTLVAVNIWAQAWTFNFRVLTKTI